MKTTHITTALALSLGFAAATLGGGCSSDGARVMAPGEQLGSAHLAVTDVPADVSCLRIDADGSTTVSTLVDVTPGQPADIELTEQPVGLVAFSAAAFPSICSAVTSESVATWLSDTVYADLTAGVAFSLSLTLHENGVADVGVDFESTPACHDATQVCLVDADCCSGLSCDGNACAPLPVSACDNTGTCGDQGTGCVACAFAGSCAAASDACLNDADCLGYLDCVGVCADQTCADVCAASHPTGAAAYDALLSCVYCDQCPIDCDPASLGVSCP